MKFHLGKVLSIVESTDFLIPKPTHLFKVLKKTHALGMGF